MTLRTSRGRMGTGRHLPARAAPRGTIAVLLLAVAAGCVQSPLPLTMAPAPVRERVAEPHPATIALLDAVDERPSFERGAAAIEECGGGGRFFALDRFWSFHAADPSLEADPATEPEVRARVTGAAAFSWYPHPNHGWGKPLSASLPTGLADYLALALEQRGLFARVIRCRDAATARSAGATLLLETRVDHFGALFVERRDPLVVRSDDWVEFRLLAGSEFTVAVTSLADGAPPADSAPPFERHCQAREDLGRLLDSIEHYRGRQRDPLWQLDAADFPGMAEAAMAERAKRSLEAATAPLLADLEARFAQAGAPTTAPLPTPN